MDAAQLEIDTIIFITIVSIAAKVKANMAPLSFDPIHHPMVPSEPSRPLFVTIQSIWPTPIFLPD